MPDDDTLDDVERWFRSRGIPHFIDDYSASRDAFTHALPALTLILLLELVGALSFKWPWWVNLGVAAASLGALLGVWAVVNALRKRPALARPDRVGPTELAIFVLLVPVLDLVAGGQRYTALNTLLANLVLVGPSVFFVGFGLLTVTPGTSATWVGGEIHVLLEGELWGRPVALTSELLQVAGFLTAFPGFYFTVYVLTDATYRREFLDEVLAELRQAFAVRAVYLAARSA